MRSSAESVVPLGEVGDWDRFQIMITGAPPVPVGDRLHIYYRGTSRRHNKVVGEFEPRIDPDQERGWMSIGLAMLRLDGFASIDASYGGGTIITVPFELAVDELHVNAKWRLRSHLNGASGRRVSADPGLFCRRPRRCQR